MSWKPKVPNKPGLAAAEVQPSVVLARPFYAAAGIGANMEYAPAKCRLQRPAVQQ